MKVKSDQFFSNPSAHTIAQELRNGPVIGYTNGYCQWGYNGGILSSADFDNPEDPLTDTGADYECNASNINHSISIVGIQNVLDPNSGTDVPCFIIQNSWGTDHGEDGYEYVLIEDGPGFGGLFRSYMYTVEMEKLAVQSFSFETVF